MNEVAPLNCTVYPSGKHLWSFLVCNGHSDIYVCACHLQQTVKHGNKPYGKVDKPSPHA